MKKRRIAVLLILACLIGIFAGCAGEEKEYFDIKSAAPQGFIHANGMDLELDGKTVLLKGVNAGGWLLTEDWLTPTSLTDNLGGENGQYELEAALTKVYGTQKTQALFDTYRDNWWTVKDFENIAAIGFNLVRLPFGWKDLTDENGKWKANAFKRLDWFVENCAKNNLFVILDLHGAYGSQNGRHHSGDTTTGGDLFGNEKNEQLTLDLWQGIARHFKDNRWVAGYDLLNEPEGKPDGLTEQVQWDYYDRLYKAIRAVDNNHLLLMESCWDADHMPDPHNYGWENIAYEYHYYNWENGNDLSSMKSFLRYKSKLERKYNKWRYQVPVFIGEFTFFDNPDCWRYGLEFFEKHGMSWAMWTYKGQVHSDWVLYQGTERNADTVVTPQTDYEKAMRIFKSTQTEKAFSENTQLVKILKEYLP
ncbi:MAG: glycoside hydrolase family 5 protein [Ruminococcaceae bacterium]|nr:glycoside hydrolase family 5 protein [Oscillospiraceae bacterium]